MNSSAGLGFSIGIIFVGLCHFGFGFRNGMLKMLVENFDVG